MVCDLVVDGVWQWSGRVTTERHVAKVDILGEDPTFHPVLPNGLHQLQCYEHAIAPGETWATLPIVVADGDPMTALLDIAESEGLDHPSALKRPPRGSHDGAMGWWQTSLRDTPRDLENLVNTREDDLAAQAEADASLRLWLIGAIALVFLLVLLWGLDMILRNILETRDNMRQYTLEALADSDTPEEVRIALSSGLDSGRGGLTRTRGILVMVVIVGTVVLNILAILAFFLLAEPHG